MLASSSWDGLLILLGLASASPGPWAGGAVSVLQTGEVGSLTIPPPPESCLGRKQLAQLLQVFPCRVAVRFATPLHQDLREGAKTLLTHSALKNLDRNFEDVVRCRQGRRNLRTRADAGLELRDVEHGVHSARRRQVQLVRHHADAFHDAEGPEELEGQLVVCTPCNGLLNVWLKAQEHLVSHGELALGAMLVYLVLHALLHASQMLTHRCKHHPAVPATILAHRQKQSYRKQRYQSTWVGDHRGARKEICQAKHANSCCTNAHTETTI